MTRKRAKIIALLMVALLSICMLSGCGSSKVDASTLSGQTIYGEVTAVNDDSITVDIGTKDEVESDSLEMTGESTTIAVSDDTTITKESNGGQGGTPPDSASKGDSEGGSSEPPEKPDGDSSEPPAKPSKDSDSSDSSNDDNNSESKPDGDSSELPAKPGEDSEDVELSDIEESDILQIVIADDGSAESITIVRSTSDSEGQGSPAANIDYTALNEYSENTTLDGDSIESSGTDENAILLSTGNVTLDIINAKISRNSSDSTGGDNSSFYGVGAAILATAGEINVENTEITTDSDGGAGAFAYGDGTVNISDSTITTKQDTSGGIHVAGGGTLHASNLNVTTNGESSAAIRSDRGSGKMTVDGGTYTSNGTGSPAIYSTADIAVQNATLVAKNSEAICIEGLNSIHLYDSDLTGNMKDDEEQNDITWNVILYQSMSGDSEEGNSTFEMVGGTLTAKNGGMFYSTNTESTFTLKDVDITYAEDSEFFLQVTGNTNERGWGTVGSNGADTLFTAIEQEMQGDVIWDTVSQLDFYMSDGSKLTGAIVNDETYAGDGGDGYANIYIDSSSTWIVTGDSTLTSLSSEGTIVDESSNTVTVKGTDGSVYVEGSSEYTITVESYSDSADMSGASEVSTYDDYTSSMSNDSAGKDEFSLIQWIKNLFS